MERRPMGLRRIGFVMALLFSAATFAYSLTGIVSAGDELRSAAAPQAKKREAPVSYERCREARDERVRL